MRLIFFFLLTMLISPNLCAQEKVELKEQGLSFTIPQGWTGQQSGEYYIFGHNSIAGLLILSLNQAPSTEVLKSEAEQGIVEEGVYLQPDGAMKVVGNKRVEGYYTGNFDGATVRCRAIGLVNTQGSGLTILTLTTTEAFGVDQEKTAESIAKSATFYAPIEADATKEWKVYLVGKKLQYMNTVSSSDYDGGYSGTSEKVIFNLYENGAFWYYSNNHSSFDTSGGFGYANSNGEEEGSYEIKTIGGSTYLLLHLNNGEEWEYAITTNQEGHTLLNGSRYFVVDIGE